MRPATQSGSAPPEDEPYNIIPLHNLLFNHPSLRFPEVRAAIAQLPTMDLLDWLALFFGFQRDNVKNQREHLILHLANAQMRLSPPPDNIDVLDVGVLRTFLRKLLKNYTNCRSSHSDHRHDLLYVGLYLLIWGESANLRFMPECICYIFHNMAMELNRILEDYIDQNTENGFLNCVVKPIYETVKMEVECSKNGTAPHHAWRNYDDLNEYFWGRRCFHKLKWPIDAGCKFFVTSSKRKRVGKTGSFDRLWVMLFLFLQAAILVAWEGEEYPWQALKVRDVQVRILTVFALLDAGMQCRRVSFAKLGLGLRMLLKVVVALAWIMLFAVLYGRIWVQRNKDKTWSEEANRRVFLCLQVAFVFVLPEVLANFIEESNWIICYLMTWWFQSKSFVGRGLREGLFDNVRYTLFWAIEPMIKPTKQLMDLMEEEYDWDEPYRGRNKLAVGWLWLPIWYSIYSSFVGAGVGLFQHLGEIRNIQQLSLRFQFFAKQLLTARGSFKAKIKDAIHRLKLRYGFGKPYKKLESNQVGAHKFALIWNEIITTFREEDIISDLEVELLELPHNAWNVRVICWPCFLLCNELLLALSESKELVDAPDKLLWSKICKNEYRRCAVIEAYDSVKHMMFEILNVQSEEHSILSAMFQEIDHSIEIEKFIKTFKMTVLPQIHMKLIKLVQILTKPKKDVNRVVNTLQALYEIVVRDFIRDKRTVEQLREDGLAPLDPAVMAGLLFGNAVKLPDPSNEKFYRQARRLLTILTSRDSVQNIPANIEARRRIAFFSNSLFMKMPHAPQVEKMMAFSVLTPYYNEEVLYNKEQLDDEWKKFMERMRREGMVKDEEIWTTKMRDLRLWASYRGQTLSRTVRGMMYYFRALKLLAFLDSASEMDIKEGVRELGSMGRDVGLDSLNPERSPSPSSLSRASTGFLFKGHEQVTSSMKYTYVIACQIYGAQKAKKDPRAEEILYLMKHNEALRVAYVDEVSTGRDEKEYYSVLVKYDQQLQKEVEIYRVKLPGPLRLGEGKPENQNHALIFTRGDAVQTIDMNQDSYFEEALKIRNLLEEYGRYYGIRKPTILGVREHIFTGSVSSLAWFMSAQETSFVTLGQRVLANPLKIRMHYGHPDIFDRFWFLTRGGISKASRVINISEDIFAGFNCTLRGGNVTHHEYIQVGKGRDVGLNQISMFEAKVASGNGEQVLSRDVYRLGHRLDFFRMLSFFYTTVGFFFNTMMVVLTVYVFLWSRLYLALSGVEKAALANSNNNKALGAILNQQFIIQLGLFTALPMIVENSLEHGFLQAIWDFLTMQLQLSSVFYTFSMGTRTHFFGRTVLHGGAKYRATGRGFVVQHKSFSENYRLYARSHFIKAIELGLILTDTLVYIAMTISSWFLVISWIMAPFVFNPSGFDWLKTVYDFDEFMNWIWYDGSLFAKAEQSWERWWYEEQEHLRTTSPWGKRVEILLDLRFFFFQYGIVHHLGIAANSTSFVVYLLSWIYIFVAFGIFLLISYARDKYAAKEHIYFRLVQFLVTIVGILVIVVLLQFTAFKFSDVFTSLLAFIPTGWGLLSIAQVLRPLVQSTRLWDSVVYVARLYDILFGVIVMAPVAFLSWTPGCQSMQTRILFNEAFSRGLRIFQIVTGKKSGDI
ncbi:hypothetical protein ES319_A13G059400v1 [Gossypium barbadense]|uniref:1,3-beta-glucan synthase n=1 Tax=Gossypium barbadense TaxID=3634 RepID=A0A5J5SVF0_GOSBA|nr:hypothetical protein ES319_A13G059400v1 [Gossypium barbadense]